jgi:hypothetical protein
VAGIDGPWVDTTDFAADRSALVTCDIREPFDIGRTFDLVLCIEVAEHLPARRADSFVADLCRLGPVVVFSAAVPGQGGYGHVNEQWPAYWFTPFESAGYALLDPLRDRMWDDPVGPAYLARTSSLPCAARRSTCFQAWPPSTPGARRAPSCTPEPFRDERSPPRKRPGNSGSGTPWRPWPPSRQRTMKAVRRVRHADS